MTEGSLGAREPRDRIAGFLVHVALAVPAVCLLLLSIVALVLLVTGLNRDAHGLATAFALGAGAVALLPTVGFAWLVRRWWSRGSWRALAAADAGLALAGAAIAVNMSKESARADVRAAVIYSALAAGAALLVVFAARHSDAQVTFADTD